MPRCPFCRDHKDTGAELQSHISLKHPEETTDPMIARRQQPKIFKKKEKSPPVVVDGNSLLSFDTTPSISSIKTARAQLMKDGMSPIILVSKEFREKIDQPMELNRLINLKWILEVAEDVNCSRTIVEEAQKLKCDIISNDRFEEFLKDFDGKEWNLKKAIKKFAFNEGKFVLV